MGTVSIKDTNSVASMIAVLNSDGRTVVPLQASSNKLKANLSTSGSDNGPSNALKDTNGIATLLAVSEDDGVTIVPLYADSLGRLLMSSM